jgi:hypothetical protein
MEKGRLLEKPISSHSLEMQSPSLNSKKVLLKLDHYEGWEMGFGRTNVGGGERG